MYYFLSKYSLIQISLCFLSFLIYNIFCIVQCLAIHNQKNLWYLALSFSCQNTKFINIISYIIKI